jgi:hypothetical protein
MKMKPLASGFVEGVQAIPGLKVRSCSVPEGKAIHLSPSQAAIAVNAISGTNMI